MGEHSLGTNDDIFNEPSLKHRTGVYLKSVEELQVDGKSPFLEIGTNKGRMTSSPDMGQPEPGQEGTIGLMNI